MKSMGFVGVMFFGFATLASAGNSRPPFFAYVKDNVLTTVRCTTPSCEGEKVITSHLQTSYVNKQKTVVPRDGRPQIFYIDLTGLKLAECLDGSCTQSLIHALPIADIEEFSVIFNNSNTFPYIAYRESLSNNVHLIRCLNRNCSQRSSVFIATALGSSDKVGLARSPNGYPAIAMQNPNGAIRYVLCQNADCSADQSQTQLITAGSISASMRLVIAFSQGLPKFMAYSGSGSTATYFTCSTLNCSSYTYTSVNFTSLVTEYGLGFSELSTPIIVGRSPTSPAGARYSILNFGQSDPTAQGDSAAVNIYASTNFSAMDFQVSGEGRGSIAYSDRTVGGIYELRFANCSDNACFSRTNVVIDNNISTYARVNLAR